MQIWPIEIDGFELSGGNHNWYLLAESDFQTDSDEMREHNRSGDYCADTRQTKSTVSLISSLYMDFAFVMCSFIWQQVNNLFSPVN